jgi:osmotically-inducible protein OsmY
MSQVEDAVPEYIDLGKKQARQLENFVNLLVELEIITPPEQCFSTPISDADEMGDGLVEKNQSSHPESDLLVYQAYLESDSVENADNSDIVLENNEQTIEIVLPILKILEANTVLPSIAEQKSEKSQADESIDTILAFEKLQEILVGGELIDLNNLVASIKQNLIKLEHQIYDPKELINLLLPSISELLRLKIADSKEEIAQIIVPIIDQAIRGRMEVDKISMSSAIAPAVPLAIYQQILVNPDEVSDAFAPTMGRAIKKQVELEQNIVVDALYPIIGSTIAKYMAETLRAINQQVEEALSVEGIKRKIRAKLQGVSEAELILKEALPFTVQAIFLIHKESGLIISDIQPAEGQRLESEMVAGMLTAIRSFANDCIIKSGSISELDAIDYGTSKIILEVAGYCYLAIVIQGESTKSFISKMRQILGEIVKNYGQLIEQFDGNPDTIPVEIQTTLQALNDEQSQEKKPKNQPSFLLILSFSVLSSILITWGIWQYHNGVIRAVEDKTSLALASTPELAVYRLTVQEKGGKLKLTGRVPNEALRNKAEQVAKLTAHKWSIDNQILTVEVPPDLVLAAAEVKRVTAVLNKMDGVTISTQYLAAKVSVNGTVNYIKDTKTIQNALEQIPGVKSISIAVQVQPLRIAVRFYFAPNSATIPPVDLRTKIKLVKSNFSWNSIQ